MAEGRVSRLNRQLAGAGDLGAFQAAAFGNLHRPDLETGIRHLLAQDDVRRLIEGSADSRVADTANRTSHIGLAGLVLPGCHPKMRPHGPRSCEPMGIIDRRREGDRHHRSDTFTSALSKPSSPVIVQRT